MGQRVADFVERALESPPVGDTKVKGGRMFDLRFDDKEYVVGFELTIQPRKS